MARKPRAENPAPEADATQTAVAEVLTAAQQAMPALQAVHGEEFAFINQLLGQTQAFNAASDFLRLSGVSKLAYVRESKAYKAIAGMKSSDGRTLSGTFDDFCSLLGISASKAHEDIANLQSFGEQALESMSRMGIGYRELRQYRRLPEDEKTALIEVAKAGDKDALVEFAETIFEKHSKEKTELTKKLDDAKAELKAKDDVASENASRIKELQEKVARIKNTPPDEVSTDNRTEVTTLVNQIDHDLRVNLYNALAAVRDHDGDNDIDYQDFIKAQVEQMEAAIALVRRDMVIGVEWEQG